MDKIVVNFEPFDRKHDIIVFQDGEVIKVANSEYDDLPVEIKKLCDEYSISNVLLAGPGAMLSKVQEQVLGLNTFETNNLTVTIMER